ACSREWSTLSCNKRERLIVSAAPLTEFSPEWGDLGRPSIHVLSHALCGVVGHLERHVGDSLATLHRAFDRFPHEIALHRRNILRRPASPQLVHAFHAVLDLMPKEGEIFLGHSLHPFGQRGRGMENGRSIACSSFG